MVFGNMGDNSGTGVGFTRDPSTGKKDQEQRLFIVNTHIERPEQHVALILTPNYIR